MEKSYDREANNRTVKHLHQKTVLLGAFYTIAGINSLLMFVWALISGTKRGLSIGLLIMGILMLVMVPIGMLDRRREMRDLFAVIGASFVCLFVNGLYVRILIQARAAWWCIPMALAVDGLLLVGGWALGRHQKSKPKR